MQIYAKSILEINTAKTFQDSATVSHHIQGDYLRLWQKSNILPILREMFKKNFPKCAGKRTADDREVAVRFWRSQASA